MIGCHYKGCDNAQNNASRLHHISINQPWCLVKAMSTIAQRSLSWIELSRQDDAPIDAFIKSLLEIFAHILLNSMHT